MFKKIVECKVNYPERLSEMAVDLLKKIHKHIFGEIFELAKFNLGIKPLGRTKGSLI